MKLNNEILKEIADLVENMRAKRPLVECLTNRVTINDCANMLLAMGASPIMAEIEEEMPDIMKISDALVINLGLLDKNYISAMKVAAMAAKRLNKPIVLDPVGAGASALRDRIDAEMIEAVKPDIIRGNLSEIKALSGVKISSKGVDASADDAVTPENSAEYGEMVRRYAEKCGCVVCATGETDIVSDGSRTVYIKNGHKMLCDVTGTGCMCTAMTGAMAASGNSFAAAAAAVLMLSIAGELAHEYVDKTAQGIGTFRIKLFDCVYNMTAEDFIKRGEIYSE